MRIQVHSEQLKEAFKKLLTISEKKSMMPVLAYALVEVSGDHVYLSASDLEVSARVIVDARVESVGSFCINVKNIFEILKEIPISILSISLDEEKNLLHLTCNDIHFSLLVYRTNDFPRLNFSTEENEFFLPRKELGEVIDKISHAISLDETRIYFNGIFLQYEEGKINCVATDGFRLALMELAFEYSSHEMLKTGIIIPRKGVYEIRKLIESGSEEKLLFSVDNSFLYLSAGKEHLLSVRLIGRDYPKYQSVIPKRTPTLTTIKLHKTLFLEAIKRVKLMANESTNAIRLLVKEKEMIISAKQKDFGDAQEKIPIEYSGKEFEIRFNGRFLTEALYTFDSDALVYLEFNNPLTPAMLRSESRSDYFCIIGPINTP